MLISISFPRLQQAVFLVEEERRMLMDLMESITELYDVIGLTEEGRSDPDREKHLDMLGKVEKSMAFRHAFLEEVLVTMKKTKEEAREHTDSVKQELYHLLGIE